MSQSNQRTTLVQTYSGSFSPLKIPNFRLYLGGQAVSLMGTWMQVTAQAWVVWELSHSEASLGIVAMMAGLPLFVLGPWAGVIADRLDRRRLLIGTQTVAMLLAFILAFLVQTHLVQVWHIYLLALSLGTVTALDFPAQQTFIGDLSGMGQIRRAVTLNIMMVQVARMLGPMLAGLVIGRFGAATAFWINGISFIAVILSLLAVRSSHIAASRASAASGFRDALAVVRRQPRMIDLLAFALLVTFFGLAVFNIFPALADKVLHGDAQTLGLLLGSSGAGALVSTLVLLPLSQAARHVGRIVGGAALWMGAWFLVVAASGWLPLSMAAIFCVSLGAPLVLTNGMGVLQLLAPHDMRARVISLFTMISFGMQPLASLAIGFSAQTFGVQTAILISGLALMSGAGLMLAFRQGLRGWELLPQAVPEPAHKPTLQEAASAAVLDRAPAE